jgi:regulator of nonsense transcripts 2
MAMLSQQEAERAEQQRIKNLVLNYDLTDEHDGEEPAFHYVQSAKNKRTVLVGKGNLNKSLKSQRQDIGPIQPPTCTNETIINPAEQTDFERKDSFTDGAGHIDHPHGQPRQDKSGNTRSKQRARKLQLGDIDWYGKRSSSTSTTAAAADTASENLSNRSASDGSYARHRGSGNQFRHNKHRR